MISNKSTFCQMNLFLKQNRLKFMSGSFAALHRIDQRWKLQMKKEKKQIDIISQSSDKVNHEQVHQNKLD